MEKEGGWREISADGPALKPGMSDLRIPAIREHLIMTGDHQGEAGRGQLYDPQLAEAVKRFRRGMVLKPRD